MAAMPANRLREGETSMSMQALLMPVFAQVALTFVLLFWMQFLRMRAIRQAQVPAHSIALREPNWPARVTQVGNAYHNQLETPLLFYVLILLAHRDADRGLRSCLSSAGCSSLHASCTPIST